MNFFLQPESCDVRSGRADNSGVTRHYVLITGVSPNFKQRVAVAHQVQGGDEGLAFADKLGLSNPSALHEAGLYVSGVILDAKLTEDMVTMRSKTVRMLTPEEMIAFRRDMRFREFYSKMFEVAARDDPAKALATILHEAERYAMQAGYVDVLPGLSAAFDRVATSGPIHPPHVPRPTQAAPTDYPAVQVSDSVRAPQAPQAIRQVASLPLPAVPGRAAADAPSPGGFPIPSGTRPAFAPPLRRPAPPAAPPVPQQAQRPAPESPSNQTVAPGIPPARVNSGGGFSPPNFGQRGAPATVRQPAAPSTPSAVMRSRFSNVISRSIGEDAGNPTMDDGGYMAP